MKKNNFLFAKVLGLALAVVMLVGLVSSVGVSAAKKGLAKPVIKLKTVNDGVGVNITIKKTKGAEGFFIFMTNRQTEDSSNMENGGKYDELITEIKKNGKKARKYTIAELPKGTYTFKAAAYKGRPQVDGSAVTYPEMVYGKEKSITIKVGKEVKVDETENQGDGNNTVEEDPNEPEIVKTLKKAKTGDYVTFGSYEQDGDLENGAEAIEWRVLSVDDNHAFLLSKYALEGMRFDARKDGTEWENSEIRQWLNDDFYKAAFTDEEAGLIEETKLTNPEPPTLGVVKNYGKDTTDKVFLLSYEEAENTKYGFSSDSVEDDAARRCAPTQYALAKTANESSKHQLKVNESNLTEDGEAACSWYLRNVKFYKDNLNRVISVGFTGFVSNFGEFAFEYSRGIRPAIYISLK